MIKKRSVKVAGHLTSLSLEEEFWTALQSICHQKGQSLNQLVTKIDAARDPARQKNLSSAVRVYVLKNAQTS